MWTFFLYCDQNEYGHFRQPWIAELWNTIYLSFKYAKLDAVVIVNTIWLKKKFFFPQPERYLSHLLGHEGPGSLLSALKSKGLSSNLEAGARIGARGFGFFSVTVDLTAEGLNNTDDIVDLIFQVFSSYILTSQLKKMYIFLYITCQYLRSVMGYIVCSQHRM
jgi:secreted Zn-dependent insulinase-like peptidase